MSKPIRIQRRRTKGWKMPENTVYVGRPGRWGNPYKIGQHNIWNVKDSSTGKSLKDILIERNGENVYRTKQDVVDAYREKTKVSGAMRRLIKTFLKGKNLACWCKEGEPCHADVLLEISNK